ncbi:hypothetical protein, partial [Parasutterella excrementihominis]|uniref:hypothetical protein n=1 Tax=Parasutterella excrementihominis TaxID=487175 RepID=UPI003AB4D883
MSISPNHTDRYKIAFPMFQWIFSSHDNPGRRQPDEAFRKIDKVGPFNYKGLVTPWEAPKYRRKEGRDILPTGTFPSSIGRRCLS